MFVQMIHIMNVTDKTPLEICLMWNECYKEDFNHSATRWQYKARSQDLGRVRSTGRSDVELEGMLKVLHVTDIHADWLYTPVSTGG